MNESETWAKRLKEHAEKISHTHNPDVPTVYADRKEYGLGLGRWVFTLL